MKRQVKNMLIILTCCLALINIVGCADKIPTEKKVKVVYVPMYVSCPKADKPVYGGFNNEIHVGHLGNLEMMRQNLERALRYNDSLENTIDCYEKQTETFNDKDK